MLINLNYRLWNKVNRTVPTGGWAEAKVDIDMTNDELRNTAAVLSGEYVTLDTCWEGRDLSN
jgi:hypothetical protein